MNSSSRPLSSLVNKISILLLLNMVSVYYQNARGLRTKTFQFHDHLAGSAFDLICISETWLLPEIHDSLLFPANFTPYRTDRPSSIASRGGGTLIAVRYDIPATRRSDIEMHFKSTWIALSLKTTKLLIGTIYIQPNTSLEDYAHFADFLIAKLAAFTGSILILGDFNCYVPNGQSAFGSRSRAYDIIEDSFSAFDLHQINQNINCTGRILDHIWTNSPVIDINHSKDPLVHEDPYHPALAFILRHSLPSYKKPIVKRDFKAGDYLRLYQELSDKDWTGVFSTKDPDLAADIFHKYIEESIDNNIPLHSTHHFPTHHTSLSSETRSLLNKKRKYHRKYHRTKLPTYYQLFSHCRHLVKTQLATARAQLHERLIKDDHYCFRWANSKGIGKPNDKHLISTNFPDIPAADLAQSFANQFQIHSRALQHNVHSNQHYNTLPPLLPPLITIEDVKKATNNLKPSRFPGPDGLPPFILKGCIDPLCGPLTHIFNCSLATGRYPSSWKKAYILPRHKAGLKSQLSNYRPISILGTCAKIFDRIITKHLTPSYSNYISPHQHGFLQGRSTETNLVAFLQTASRFVGCGGQLDTLFIDLSKAFDTVPHSVIVQQLGLLGCSPLYLEWFNSYLTNRLNFVFIDGLTSSAYTPNTGVPQGSVLGPLLFNLAVNPIPTTCKRSHVLMYADDIKIFRPIASPQDAVYLQEDLSSIVQWCASHGLSVNIEKTVLMCFTRKHHPTESQYLIGTSVVKSVLQHRDLGIFLTHDLRLNPQVDHICRLANWQCSRILRATACFNSSSLPIRLFKIYISPILCYASCAWNNLPKYLSHRLDQVLHRFARTLAFRGHSYRDVIGDLNAPFVNLNHKRNCRDAQFLLHLLVGNISAPSLLELIPLKVPRLQSRHSGWIADLDRASPLGRAAYLVRHLDPEPELWHPHKQRIKLVTLADRTLVSLMS